MMIKGNAIRYAEIHRLVGALCLEIGGLGSRVPNMRLAKEWCGSVKRTKAGVLEDLVVWFYANNGKLDAQWRSVERALGADRTAKLKTKAEKVSGRRVDGEAK